MAVPLLATPVRVQAGTVLYLFLAVACIKMSTVKLCFGLFVNILSAVSIVLVNKWIFKYKNFPKITLACIHLLFMAVLLELSLRLQIFKFKSNFSAKKLIPLSVSFSGSLAMANYSLQQNSVVGFQLFKAMVMPFIIALQTICFNRAIPRKMKISLVNIIKHMSVRS